MTDDEKVENYKDEIARRRAKLDQRAMQFSGQYHSVYPHINLQRITDLEIWKFRIEMIEWELEQDKETFDLGET